MINLDEEITKLKGILAMVRGDGHPFRPQLMLYAGGLRQATILSRPYHSSTDRDNALTECFGAVGAFGSDELIFAVDTWLHPGTNGGKLDAFQIDAMARVTGNLVTNVYPYVVSADRSVYWLDLGRTATSMDIGGIVARSAKAAFAAGAPAVSPHRYSEMLRTKGFRVLGSE